MHRLRFLIGVSPTESQSFFWRTSAPALRVCSGSEHIMIARIILLLSVWQKHQGLRLSITCQVSSAVAILLSLFPFTLFRFSLIFFAFRPARRTLPHTTYSYSGNPDLQMASYTVERTPSRRRLLSARKGFGMASATLLSQPGWTDASRPVLEFVDLLHEGGLCVDQALRAQQVVDLRYHLRRFESMLQHRLYPDHVDGSVQRRQLLRIQKVDVRRIGDIEEISSICGSVQGRSDPTPRVAPHTITITGRAGEPSAAPGTAWRSSPHRRWPRRGA